MFSVLVYRRNFALLNRGKISTGNFLLFLVFVKNIARILSSSRQFTAQKRTSDALRFYFIAIDSKVKFVALNEVFHICCQNKHSAKLKEKVNVAVKPRKDASSTECTDVLSGFNSSSFSNSLSYQKTKQ